MASKREHRRPLAALEISHSRLRMIRLEPAIEDERAAVRTRSIVWRNEANSLHSDAGKQELKAALRRLVHDEKLAGSEIRLALGGGFCVTRVVTGTEDRVRRELAALRERSQLYLTLGPGEKSLAAAVRQIDARHQHALLAVANERTLDALLEAGDAVGVRFSRVEPSLVALARILGRLKLDHDQPVLVAYLDAKGVELGIAYQGALLLDYRPGGKAVHAELAEIISKHLARLRRYCTRYFRFASGTLDRVYLCGEAEAVQLVQTGFEGQTALQAEPLDLAGLNDAWRLEEGELTTDIAAACGTAVLTDSDEAAPLAPNLLEKLGDRTIRNRPRALLGTLWPVAASLLAVVGMWGATVDARMSVAALEAKLATLEPAHREILRLRGELTGLATKQSYLEQIARQTTSPDWSELARQVGRALPQDVWLDTLKAEGDGRVSITGRSRRDEAIYQFVAWLNRTPSLEGVSVLGTRQGTFHGGPATTFQLEGKLAKVIRSAGPR